MRLAAAKEALEAAEATEAANHARGLDLAKAKELGGPAHPGRLSTLIVSHSKSGSYGAFVCARSPNGPKRRFLARAVAELPAEAMQLLLVSVLRDGNGAPAEPGAASPLNQVHAPACNAMRALAAARSRCACC